MAENVHPPGNQALTRFIRSIFPMPLPQAEAIAAGFTEKKVRRNDLLLKAGKPCDEYGFLEDGFMRSFTHDLDGNDVTTAFYVPNQVVCELDSFFKRTPAREAIQALTDCTVWFLSFEGLQEVFHARPEFREFGRLVLVNAYAQLRERMLSTLHETAEQRYANLMNANPALFQHAPLKMIASYLGVTDTSLSRIRKSFAKHHGDAHSGA